MDHLRLLPPGSGAGFVGDLAIPADFYWVTRVPAPLAGMGYPRGNSWEALAHAGFQHVVCLTHAQAPYDSSPLATHHAQMQDMYAAFNAWKERFKANIVDMGDKLKPGGKVVTASGVTDGAFVEAKEVVGGFMIVTAESWERAIEVAKEMPMMMPGARIEIREMAGA